MIQNGKLSLANLIVTFVNADSWEESQSLVEQYPELLTDEADDLLKSLADFQDDTNVCQMIEYHRALLQRCRQIGIEAVFAQEMEDDDSDIWPILEACFNTTWSEAQKIVEQHPELLTDETQVFLHRLAKAQEDDRAQESIEKFSTLLQRCREIGIEAAFAEKIGPPQLQSHIRRAKEAEDKYLQANDLEAIDEAAAIWEYILNHRILTESDPELQLALFNDAAAVFRYRYQARGYIDDLNRAIAL